MTASPSSSERVTYRLEEADSTPVLTPASPASLATSKIGPEGHIYHNGKTYAVSLYGEGYDLKTNTSDWKKAAKKIVEYLGSIKQLPQAVDETVDINCSNGTLSKKGPKDSVFQALPCTLESSQDIQKFYTELHKCYEDFNKKPAVKSSSSATSKSPISITPLNSFKRAAEELREGVMVSNETVGLILSTIEQQYKNIKTQEIDIPSHLREGLGNKSKRSATEKTKIKLFQGISGTGSFVPMPGGGYFDGVDTSINRDYFIKNGFYGAVFRDHIHFFAIFADIKNKILFVMDPLNDPPLSGNSVEKLGKAYDLEDMYHQIFGEAPKNNSIRDPFNKKVQNDPEGPVNCGLHSTLFIEQFIELANRNRGSIWDGDNIRNIDALIGKHKEIILYRNNYSEIFDKRSPAIVHKTNNSTSPAASRPPSLIDDDHEDADDKNDEDSSGDLTASSSILLNPPSASTTVSTTSAPLPPSSTVVNGVNISNESYFPVPAASTATSSSSSAAASTATAPAIAPKLSLWERLKKLKFW